MLAAVALKQVGKTYADTPVLSDITTHFPADTLTAIVGRSGCGKSTLLRMINGLVQPDQGTVDVLGTPLDYQNLPHMRRKQGYAVQGVGLFPHLTVAGNVSLMAKLEGWSDAAISKRLAQVLDLVQLLPALLPRYPAELSGGQAQRVGLARALMLNPPVLLLDEPFAALDSLTRLDIHEQLLRLQQQEPRCVLLVTHDMREALKLADSILVLDSGRIVLREDVAVLREQTAQLEPEQLLLQLLGEGV